MSNIEMSLAEKVSSIISGVEHFGPYEGALDIPGYEGGPLTDFEARLLAWGLFLGVAVGIARHDEPCESTESVVRRAYPAAAAGALHFSGPFERLAA